MVSKIKHVAAFSGVAHLRKKNTLKSSDILLPPLLDSTWNLSRYLKKIIVKIRHFQLSEFFNYISIFIFQSENVFKLILECSPGQFTIRLSEQSSVRLPSSLLGMYLIRSASLQSPLIDSTLGPSLGILSHTAHNCSDVLKLSVDS